MTFLLVIQPIITAYTVFSGRVSSAVEPSYLSSLVVVKHRCQQLISMLPASYMYKTHKIVAVETCGAIGSR